MFELQQNGKGLGWGGGEVEVETHAGNACAEEVQKTSVLHEGHWPAPTKKYPNRNPQTSTLLNNTGHTDQDSQV